MNAIKTSVAKVKNNPIGAVAGGVVAVVALRKFTKVRNIWATVGVGIVGVAAGAMVQSMIRSKAGAPNKDMVEGKSNISGRARSNIIMGGKCWKVNYDSSGNPTTAVVVGDGNCPGLSTR